SQCGTEQICLDEMDSHEIEHLYGLDKSDEQVQEAVLAQQEAQTDKIEFAPTSHVDSSLMPALSQNASSQLDAPFVSAQAEQQLAYQPSAEAAAVTLSRLTDSQNRPIAGIAYFTPSTRGVTGLDGQIEYRWGETITLGIETFTLGSLKGNQPSYQLADINAAPQIKQNVQQLIARYATDSGSGLVLDPVVQQVFAAYPNAINEIIRLNLASHRPAPEGLSEFEAQFNQGLAKEIDEQLRKASEWQPVPLPALASQDANSQLKTLFNGVTSFHLFSGQGGFYGAPGQTFLARNLNIGQGAFSILKPRSDSNFWLAAGAQTAWQPETGNPFVLDATTLPNGANATAPLQRPPLVAASNMRFDLPGISAGQIGQGKVVFLGNVMYPSILSCPDNYWAGNDLSVDNYQCNASLTDPAMSDSGSMAQFMKNLLTWLHAEYAGGAQSMALASNIEFATKAVSGLPEGDLSIAQYPFFVDARFNLDLQIISSGGFVNLDPATTPVLLLQSYRPHGVWENAAVATVSDINAPLLDATDIDALMAYVHKGGNIIFADAIREANPEPIAKLADSAGVVLGGGNIAAHHTLQANCALGQDCDTPVPQVHARSQGRVVVYEKVDDAAWQAAEINGDGTLHWPLKPTVSVASWQDDGSVSTQYAYFPLADGEDANSAIQRIMEAYRVNGQPTVLPCKPENEDYDYEVGCIEVRDGHSIKTDTFYQRAEFARLPIDSATLDAMSKPATVGEDLALLLAHELYFRSAGAQGQRLPSGDFAPRYQRLAELLWNDQPINVDTANDPQGLVGVKDLLDCYQLGNTCPAAALREQLVASQMLGAGGELLPSYPLNYQEKPITRLMLGRSYWDKAINVDTAAYPGVASGSRVAESVDMAINTQAVHSTVGNMQSTGLWAPQRETIAISGGVDALVTIALADDLTSRAPHEQHLRRPPRIAQQVQHSAGATTQITAPYGGLIYITPVSQAGAAPGVASFMLQGVYKAGLWRDGAWVNPATASVPVVEIDSGDMIYTAPVQNVLGLSDEEVAGFAAKLSATAQAASVFHGRDEVGAEDLHRRFTGSELPGHRHRLVNDIQLGVGSAHSGYPMQTTLGYQLDNATRSYLPRAASLPMSQEHDW
ncbi:MAG: SslE/AcfD family lipoprotein zinc metalloprotease, partial [Aeromonas sp.]